MDEGKNMQMQMLQYMCIAWYFYQGVLGLWDSLGDTSQGTLFPLKGERCQDQCQAGQQQHKE